MLKKYPKTIRPKRIESCTSDWLEFLKGLTPKQQKKEHLKRKLRSTQRSDTKTKRTY